MSPLAMFAASTRPAVRADRTPELATLARADVRAWVDGRTVDDHPFAIALSMLDELRALRAGGCQDALWALRPSWAWVWLAEGADPASWVRGVRWAQQIAARRADPAPLARFLLLYALRRGPADIRAQLAAAHADATSVADPIMRAVIEAELADLTL